MKKIKNVIFLIVSTFLFYENIRCNSMPNINADTEKVEDWEAIQNVLCKKDLPTTVQNKLEKCNEIDPFYRLDSYWNECSKLQAPGGSDWYTTERGHCMVQDCYDNATKCAAFIKVNDEIDRMNEKVKVAKAYRKYLCIRKTLGFKD